MLLTILLWIVLAIVAFGLRQPWSPRRLLIAGTGGLVIGAVFAFFNIYPGSIRGILALLAIALVVSGAAFVRRWSRQTRPLSRGMPLAGFAVILFLILAGLFPLTSWGAKSVNERVYNDLEASAVTPIKTNAPPIDRASDVRVVPWDLASQLLVRGYGADASWLTTQSDLLQRNTFPDTVNGQFIWVHAPAPETSKWLIGGRLADKALYVRNDPADLSPVAVPGVLNVQIDGIWWQHRLARYAEDNGELRYILQDVALQLDDAHHPFWIAYLATLDIRSQPHLAKLLVVDAQTGAEQEFTPDEAPKALPWLELVYPESYVYDWAQYWGLHREGLLYRWFNAAGLVQPDDVTVRYIRVQNQTFWLLPMKQLSSANLGGYILTNTKTGATTFYDRFDAQLVDYDTAWTQLQAIMASGEASKGAGSIALTVSEGYLYPIRMADGTVRDAYVFPLLAGLKVSRFAIIDAHDYNNRRVFQDTIDDALAAFSRLVTANETLPGAPNVTAQLVKVIDGTAQSNKAIVDLNGTLYTVTSADLQGGRRSAAEREFDELTLAIARANRGQDVSIEVLIEGGKVVDVTYPGVNWGS